MGGAAADAVPPGVLSLVDSLPDESQLLVDLVAQTYGWTRTWPVWQYVARQAFGKLGIDAEAVLRDLPQWPGSRSRLPGGAGGSRGGQQRGAGNPGAHGADGLRALPCPRWCGPSACPGLPASGRGGRRASG